MHQSHEKRNFFRVSEPLSIKWVQLSQAPLKHQAAADWFPALNGLHWLDEFHTITRELQRELSDQSPASATPLKLLARQSELLAATLLKNVIQADFTASNISEGGLSFTSHTPFTTGDYLALALLLNTGVPLYCYAQVLRVKPLSPEGEKEDGQLHEVAVGFLRLTATEQDRLAKQVLQSQRKRGSLS